MPASADPARPAAKVAAKARSGAAAAIPRIGYGRLSLTERENSTTVPASPIARPKHP